MKIRNSGSPEITNYKSPNHRTFQSPTIQNYYMYNKRNNERINKMKEHNRVVKYENTNIPQQKKEREIQITWQDIFFNV